MNESKITPPPYLSIAKMKEVVEKLEKKSLNTLESKDFKAWGFSSADANLAIATLKFLKIIDENGKIDIDKSKKFKMSGEEKEKMLKELVQSAYKPLFDENKEPGGLSNGELNNDFIRKYNCSPRLLTSAIPLFKYLCSIAGFIPKEQIVSRPKKKDNTNKNLKDKMIKVKSAQTRTDSDDYVIPVLDGISIVVSGNKKDLYDSLLKGVWDGKLASLKQLINKIIKNHANDNAAGSEMQGSKKIS